MPSPVSVRVDTQPLRRAAQYIRMSTEQQSYSPKNQADAIAAYAFRHGFEIVRTYSDEGKSGLTFDGRKALQALVSDIVSGAPGFEAVIVYDVSRWGRFQDADESAHYEFLCRRAGVDVLYCAEQFDNDGSPVSTIVKGMKRAMAGEYSRELGVKVQAGKRLAAAMGFFQGTSAGYGLRRMLVDERRNRKGILKTGQRKALNTDRIILVPGPQEEVKVVNRIYRMVVDGDMSILAIARSLNARGITALEGRPWTKDLLTKVLTRERYIGHNVYGYTHERLKEKPQRVSSDDWVVAEDAFEPIVPKELFYAAQRVLQDRRSTQTAEEMIEGLRTLKERHGYLTARMIDKETSLPDSETIVRRFGRLVNAYHLAGYHPKIDHSFVMQNNKVRKLHTELCRAVRNRIRQLGGTIEAHPNNYNGPILINGLFSLIIRAVRCERTRHGHLRWRVNIRKSFNADMFLIARVNGEVRGFRDYILVPSSEFPHKHMSLPETVNGPLSPFVSASIDPLLNMVRQTLVTEVAP